MWWRFLTFCVLVTFVLFVVLSSIHGRPVVNLFFQRCCEDDIENDQVIFQNFANNFVRERLIGAEVVFEKDKDETNEVSDLNSDVNVHDPSTRVRVDVIEVFDVIDNDTSAENPVTKVADYDVITGKQHDYTTDEPSEDIYKGDETRNKLFSGFKKVTENESEDSREVATETVVVKQDMSFKVIIR